ncbi:RecQ-like ATP-dependent DNA helicase [Natranaerovirga hydrolytica]|uniref:DNA helicase RecQ n=1 Tax=Natranaerovirga hydrolytica TaxID=680378 RepID=A0A4R1MZM1_9FIRM|nr:DNA helicase RecQ [Natranaerovirga hydrolytica]TCK98635.1 RecQ-like ATP-dependent DNA helicase [Natranaerovirga hydrolytica]
MLETQAKVLLKKYYGYDDFREGQKNLIDNILKGKDVLGIMPTGAGKSICYQIPALLFEGITLVISPLISLMKDQVDTLNEMGIQAAFINSSLSDSEFRHIITNVRKNTYKLIYIAPERLETEFFSQFIQSLNVSMIAIDEAHCISQWGHDFRPSYRNISKAIENLRNQPIIAAFTATATPQVKEDIIRLLNLVQPYTLTTGFDRQNLYFEVSNPEDKFSELSTYIKNNKSKSGIIYASTRKTVESICKKLNKKGYTAAQYHAGLSEKERTKNQDEFLCDNVQIMVATNAFGMGIDKSNIAYVIHYNMPKNMESYYQEAGRAGRDGGEAECILFYSPADIITNRLLIENSNDPSKKKNDYHKLNEMSSYCNTDRCLRGYILEYFGEVDSTNKCGNCGNCNNDVKATDVTVEAQKIISCIKRMGERFGSVLVAEVLKGSKNNKVITMGFDKLTTYGIMKDYSKESIKDIIAYLIAEDYLILSGQQYPVLKVSSKSTGILKGKEPLLIKRVIKTKEEKNDKKQLRSDKAYDTDLFDNLRMLRKEMATHQKVPPFVVFSDVTLKEMCRHYPRDEEALMGISGVGAAKLEKYGNQFIEAIQDYMKDKDITILEQSLENETVEKQPKKRIQKESNQDSKVISYEMFQKGLGIEEIAKERELKAMTIENHLVECAHLGMTLDYNRLIHPDEEKQVLEALKVVDGNKLKPIKESLPDHISYGTIKFVKAKKAYNQS